MSKYLLAELFMMVLHTLFSSKIKFKEMQRNAILTTHPSEIRLSSLQLNFRKLYEELFIDILTFTSSTLMLNEL